MPNKICVMPSIVERLREDYKKGELNLGKLAKLTDQELNDFWKEKYGFGDTLAKYFTSRIQQAVISPKVAQSLRTVLRKDILNRGKLYSNISLDNAKALSQKYTIQQLSEMNREERTKALAPYLGKATDSLEKKERAALDIAKRIEQAAKTNKLSDISQRLFGEYSPEANRVFRKVEELAHNTLLNPANAKEYMRSLVETQLGVGVSESEAKKVYELANRVNELEKRYGTNMAITAGSDKKLAEKQIDEKLELFDAKAQLEKYTHLLETGTVTQDVGNELVNIWANTLLSSAKSLVNSALYQITPSSLRYASKRVTAGWVTNQMSQNLESTPEQLGLSSKDAEDMDLSHFVTNQMKLEYAVYDSIGEDIARMTDGSDDTYLFSQNAKAWSPNINFTSKQASERGAKLKALREAELEKSTNKTLTLVKQKTLDPILNFTAIFPKFFAGGTDVTIASHTRADSTILYAKLVARQEAKLGKLPKGYTEKARRNQLVYDAYSTGVPKDPKAQVIKARAIEDAHVSNNTQNSFIADMAVESRHLVTRIGKAAGIKTDIGKIYAPFVRIGSTNIQEGVKTATAPLYIPLSFWLQFKKINNNLALTPEEKIIRQGNLVTSYAQVGGGFVLALGIALLQKGLKALFRPDDDNEDYIPRYQNLTANEYKIARARGANPDSIRIGDTWVQLKYFQAIAPALRAIETAMWMMDKKQSWFNFMYWYGKSIKQDLLEIPVLSQAISSAVELNNTDKDNASYESLKEMADDYGVSADSILETGARSFAPGFFRDIINAVVPPEQKYDIFGNKIQRANPLEHFVSYFTSTREVKKAEIIDEFNRLNKAGNMPAVGDPDKLAAAKALKEVMPEQEFNDFVQQVKRTYTDEVSKLIQTPEYKKMTDQEKKKAIDKVRSKLMTDKKTNEFTAKLNSL